VKLTRKQCASLESALQHFERAKRYLFAPETAVARRSHGTTALDYIRPSDGKALYEVEREYGSDLTGLAMGIAELQAILHEARQ
jgi:hypothetical protein